MPKSFIMKFEDPVTKCCHIDLETRFRYTTCPYCGKAKVGCILPLCGLSFQLLCFLDGCKQRSATTTRLSFIVHLTLSFRSCLKELKVNKLSHDPINGQAFLDYFRVPYATWLGSLRPKVMTRRIKVAVLVEEL